MFLSQITWRSRCCCQTLINLPLYVCVELTLWTFESENNLHFLIIFFFLLEEEQHRADGCLRMFDVQSKSVQYKSTGDAEGLS